MIPKSFITQLVGQCDIEDLLSSYVSVKRAGRNLKALCPFHSEKTPSFVIYPESQSFYCFGCGAGGDAISFVMRAENLEYTEAVRFLARRLGMQVPDDEDDEVSRVKSTILKINKETALFFHKCLKQPIGKTGYTYFRERGLSDDIITRYGLGYAPHAWDSLVHHLKGKGYAEKDMLSAAVAARGKNGSVYDQFRNRVMFPIIDLRGNVIGFGGRVMDDSKPKYLNTPDTPLFKKSRNLFSLNFAKNETKGKLILAEGYMDVIAVYAAGFPNVVATLGTALTEEQARLMSKYASEVIIAYDSDQPGQAASMRAVNLLSDAGVSAKVLKMEGAKDPDEYIKAFGVKRFELLLDGASDIIEYELNTLREKHNLSTVEGKRNYLRGAVNILSGIKTPIDRDLYASIAARDGDVSREVVLTQVAALYQKRLRQKEKQDWRQIEQNREMSRDRINPQKIQNLKEAVAEEGILAILYKNADFFPAVQERLGEEDFVTNFNRRVYKAMTELNQMGEEITLTGMAEGFTPQEMGGISAILARNADRAATKEILADYIDVLVLHKEKLPQQDIQQTDPLDIEQYRLKLRERKGG